MSVGHIAHGLRRRDRLTFAFSQWEELVFSGSHATGRLVAAQYVHDP